MTYYIAHVRLVVDTGNEAEAADAVAEMLRPMMRCYAPESCLVDWLYDQHAEPDLHRADPEDVENITAAARMGLTIGTQG
jgi:hypothetical protein